MIGKILRNVRETLTRDSTSVIKPHDGWVESEEYAAVLRKELHRSMRSGLPLSVVMMNLPENDMPRRKNPAYDNFLEQLITSISDNTRDYDVKCINNPHKIGVILIDTPLNGARSFVDRIVTQLHIHNETSGKSECLDFLKAMKISILPFGKTENGKMISAMPVVEEKLRFKSGQNSPGCVQVLKESSNVTLDWEKVSLQGNAFTLFAPTLWEMTHCGVNNTAYNVLKRSIDIVGAVTGILLSFPFMVIIALAIKATSRGPVIFRHRRVGHKGKFFTFYKFRTMRVDGDDTHHQEYVKKLVKGKNEETNLGTKDKPLYKIRDDSRITLLGRILRKTSLDELPQFFNVLIGNMSLVGPRPALTYEAEEYKNWHWQRILETKPGMTGIWQVSGRSRMTYDDMVRLDLGYAKKRSIFLDVKILLKTFKAVIKTDGAL
jgi:lipopolysaccharide/colanic/teichoic acid biosynthesis glycosyltransferase